MQSGATGARAILAADQLAETRHGNASTATTGWDLGLAAPLLGLLFCATLFNIEPAKRTLGLGLAYTAFRFTPWLILALLERVTQPAGPRKSAKKWVLHLQIMFTNLATGVPFGILAAYLSSLLVKELGLSLGIVDLRFADNRSPLSVIAAVLMGLLIVDFFFYWYHRTLHRSRILWQHHKMHHLDPEFDALTGPRQNWVESFLVVFFMNIPIALLFKLDALDPLNGGLLNGAIIGFLNSIVLINHSNLRLQFGWAGRLFISPHVHRIHHSLLPQHQDKNFAAIFPMWDILFGTYYHPARDEFPPTGVQGEREIQSVWEVQIFALREWWKMFRAWRIRRLSA